MNKASAFAVHLLTASGAALGFLALILAMRAEWSTMFMTLGLALIADGIDGPLARKFNVSAVLPRWSGDTLDLVVDFVTYVFVPAFAITVGGLLPPALAVPAGLIIVTTGALYFADRQMKTTENYFRGFPAIWNAAAFYLFILSPPPVVTAIAIALFAALTFVPVRFIHPLRVKRMRPLNVTLLVIWSIFALVAVARDLNPGPWVTGSLCTIAAYFILVGLLPPSTDD